MGEARRRRCAPWDTLDGGEPSDDRIVLLVDLFDAQQEIDQVRLAAMVEAHKRAHQRPTPLCSACDYESTTASRRRRCTVPADAPQGRGLRLSFRLDLPALRQPAGERTDGAVVGRLCKAKPDLTVVQRGTARWGRRPSQPCEEGPMSFVFIAEPDPARTDGWRIVCRRIG
jgi:hypothetical protein